MGRYTRRGKSKIYFVTALTSTTVPPIGELTTGADITANVAEISGFTFSNSPIQVPDMSTVFVPTIAGEDAAEDSTLTVYSDDTTDALRTMLAKGTTGYIVLAPVGRVATKRCEVWPVVSTGYNDQWVSGNEAAKAVVGFAITSTPNQSATIT